MKVANRWQLHNKVTYIHVVPTELTAQVHYYESKMRFFLFVFAVTHVDELQTERTWDQWYRHPSLNKIGRRKNKRHKHTLGSEQTLHRQIIWWQAVEEAQCYTQSTSRISRATLDNSAYAQFGTEQRQSPRQNFEGSTWKFYQSEKQSACNSKNTVTLSILILRVHTPIFFIGHVGWGCSILWPAIQRRQRLISHDAVTRSMGEHSNSYTCWMSSKNHQ